MAEFMEGHPNLAKNLLPNTAQGKAQGKATSIRLSDMLHTKLNAVGPPIKDVKAWKKVFADQKFKVKKKLAFNKYSKAKTGGGSNEEKLLTQLDEQIVLATGLEAAVEGLSNVKTFGNSQTHNAAQTSKSAVGEPVQEELNQSLMSVLEDLETLDAESNPKKPGNESTSSCKKKTNWEKKMSLIQEHAKVTSNFQESIERKLDVLIEIKQKSLKIEEEKHKCDMAVHEIELKIKTLQLDMLN